MLISLMLLSNSDLVLDPLLLYIMDTFLLDTEVIRPNFHVISSLEYPESLYTNNTISSMIGDLPDFNHLLGRRSNRWIFSMKI